MAADRDVVVASVLAADPELSGELVTAIVERVAPRREQRRVLATAVSADPSWAAGSTTASMVVDRLIAELHRLGSIRFKQPRCDGCGGVGPCVRRLAEGERRCRVCDDRLRLEPCVDCERVKPVGKRLADGAASCPDCWRNRPERQQCSRCGERRPVQSTSPDGTIVCGRCYMRWIRGFGATPAETVAVCVDCGTEGFCIGITSGRPRCPRCYPKHHAPCTRCGSTRPVAVVWANHPYCNRCRCQVLDSVGDCDACGQRRRIDPRNDNGREMCSTCAGLDPLSVCTICGVEARLWDQGHCAHCSVDRRLDAWLEQTTEAIAGQFAPLRAALQHDPRLIPTPTWLSSPTGRLLEQLVNGTLLVGHDALDALGTRPAQHLRHLLVSVGVLEHRDEDLAKLERWLAARLNTIDDHVDRSIVDAYANWHVLRRRRARAARTGATDSTNVRSTRPPKPTSIYGSPPGPPTGAPPERSCDGHTLAGSCPG